jgi:hypothetical protein
MEAKITQAEFIDDMKPGEIMPFHKTSKGKDGMGIIYCCPECGEQSAGTERHEYDPETVSLSPSIIHRCGYRGYLTNGVFVKL